MSLIALTMNQYIHQHSMKMNELFVHKCIFINNNDVKIMNLCYMIEIYMIMNTFIMYWTMFVSVKTLVESWLTCRPD